jgi:transcription elongation factor/antiterminator RfaH
MSHEPRWFAVHTQPMRESLAQAQLQAQLFETFLPARLKTVSHARKLRTVVAPFFPRYLFVRIDPERQRWRAVNGTIGVVSLVMRGEAPQPVPRGVVEALDASADERGLIRLEENLAPGSRVRVMAGPFADQLGILDRLGENERIRILLDIMGTQVPVQVPRELVVAA